MSEQVDFELVGHASRLLSRLENFALAREVERAQLRTAGFQGALEFYRKQNYQGVFECEIQLPNGESDVEILPTERPFASVIAATV